MQQGEYLQFYEAGQLMTRGQYDHGHPVGKWTEYYQFRRRQKQEIQYPKDPYDTITKPYILKEWDEKGNLTYDSEKSDEKRVLSSKF
jgi:antitoxin component YwqK of YwqJK toxin-antitoxin module